MKLLPTLSIPATLLLASCWSFEHADLSRYEKRASFPMTTDPPPPGAETVGIVHSQEDGFYLFGLVPVVRVSLQGCLNRIQKRAKELDADGIADIEYHVNPAEIFKFSVFPLPDWSARALVTATAYRIRPRTAPPEEPQAGGVHTPPAPGSSR